MLFCDYNDYFLSHAYVPSCPQVVFSTLFSFSGCSYYSDSSQEEIELEKWKYGRVWVLGVIRVSFPKHSLTNLSSEIFCGSEIAGCVDTFLPHRKRGQAKPEALLSFFSFRRLKVGNHTWSSKPHQPQTAAASCLPFKPLNHPSQSRNRLGV